MIDISLDAEAAEIRNGIWTRDEWRPRDVWSRSFDIYITQAQIARPKSLRQMLATLTNSLRKANGPTIPEVKAEVLESIMDCLQDYESPHKAKASAQMLGSLVAKNVLTIEQLLQSYQQRSQSMPASSLREAFQSLLRGLFRWLSEGDFGSTISQLVVTLLDAYDKRALETGGPNSNHDTVIWSQPLESSVAGATVKVDDLRAHILPVLFKRDFQAFVAFLENHGLQALVTPTGKAKIHHVSPKASSETDDLLLYASLQTGKEIGLLFETDAKDPIRSEGQLQIPIKAMERLFLRGSRDARLTALSFLVTSHSATRPLAKPAFVLLKRYLGVFFADVDADFRSDVFGVVQRLVDRIRSITAVLARQIAHPQATYDNATPPQDLLKFHREFLGWLLSFIIWELRPTASYQRHISALKSLSILVRSGIDKAVSAENLSKSATGETKWPFEMPLLSKDLVNALLDILLDPFDDVRQTAASILWCYCSEDHTEDVFLRQRILAVLDIAENTLLLTGRADHADGVAHLYALASSAQADSQGEDVAVKLTLKLAETLHIAHNDLGDAISKYPLHGLLTSLRYVISHRKQYDVATLLPQLLSSLHQVWEVVKPILCDDAPEGYLPKDLGDSIDSSKEMLSYCWRALKEASLLMSVLLTRTSDYATLENIAGLCFTQLAELRHRGAFSTVAQTWAACCIRCGYLAHMTDGNLLNYWYARVLDMLRRNVTINTRRSAGLPSLICGILIADKSGALVAQAFSDLEAVARSPVDQVAAEEGSIPQVHAMNCMKDILKNTRLGEFSEKRIPSSLRLAADALRSDIWGVRNCGLMLFRAVIDRLLGTSEAHLDEESTLHKRISIDTHPEVLEVVSELLSRAASEVTTASTRNEGVFPALQLLQLSRIPVDAVDALREAVRKLTASTSWHVRDKAARTYASLIDLRFAELEAAVLLDDHRRSGRREHNALHGALLSAKHILVQKRLALQPDHAAADRRQVEETDILQRDIAAVTECAASLYTASACMPIKAACVDVISQAVLLTSTLTRDLPRSGAAPSAHELEIAAELASEQIANNPEAAVLRQALARLAAAYFQSTTQEKSKSLESAILQLARIDPNASAYFLESIISQAHAGRAGNDHILHDLCMRILENKAENVFLKCAAQQVLLNIDWQSQNLPWHASISLADDEVNQTLIDQDLILQGMQLELSAQQIHPPDPSLQQRISHWARSCITAVTGSGICSRESAAQSLSRTNTLWRLINADQTQQELFCQLSLSLYDLLNDDDEDIRLLAADVTTRVLAAANLRPHPEHSLEPIAASSLLPVFLLKRWSSSPYLCRLAISRAFMLNTPVSAQLQRHAHSEAVLFAEEKQNLYIDDARELRMWSQILTQLDSSALDKSSIKKLGSWVVDGIHTLSNIDLPGHTNAEVFTLGLSVIYGAEVLLHLSTSGTSSVKPSDVKTALVKWMAQVENKSSGYGLWKREMERVLQESILLKFGKVNNALEDVLMSCDPGVL